MVLSVETHNRSPVNHRLTWWHANRVTSVDSESEHIRISQMTIAVSAGDIVWRPALAMTGCPGSADKNGAANGAAVIVVTVASVVLSTTDGQSQMDVP